MPPWERQGELEAELRRLAGRKPNRWSELLAAALEQPRLSYKAAAGALVHALRRARRKSALPLLGALSELVLGSAQRFGPKNVFCAPAPARARAPSHAGRAVERLREDVVKCVAYACRCPAEQLVRRLLPPPARLTRNRRPRWRRRSAAGRRSAPFRRSC